MTYTAADHDLALTYAATSKRDRDRDGGLSTYLMSAQGGTCFDCNAAPATEFAHFTRATGRTATMGRAGALVVLGAMACRRCNVKHDRLTRALGTDGTLPYAYLAANGRADRIPTTYPTRAALVALHTETSAAEVTALDDEIAAEVAALGL